MRITAADLATITGGKLTGIPGTEVTELLTDSRQLSSSEGAVFFAIKGLNHDGHKFIPGLYGRGVKMFVAEILQPDPSDFPGSSFIEVENTVSALQKVAAVKRKNFSGRVIAVTGSAGKTVVKEWLAGIMGSWSKVLRSPRSYNSQTGVPLSVWKLSDNYDTAVFEAGISHPGEMEKLEKVIMPDTGIITNIGDAHGENFSNVKQKASEKLRLFKNCKTIIYCSDYTTLKNLITNDPVLKGRNIIDWSDQDRHAAYFVTKKILSEGTEFDIRFGNKDERFRIPFSDRASVENAVTVAVACLACGGDPGSIREGLAKLVPVAMRMEMKSGVNGCLLIEDYYNSDPGSLKMAVEYLRTKTGKKLVLILSDFVQSGRPDESLYGEVAGLIRRSGIGRFIGIGDALSENNRFFNPGSRFFSSTDEFMLSVSQSDFSDEVILLKGARKFEFERISQMLVKQVHQTVLEINLDAIARNLDEIRRCLKSGTRIMAMVKAFAYGAGPAEIAALLEFHRIDYLAVAIADEGVALRKAGVSVPVVVMNPEPSSFGMMFNHNLEPEIYSMQLLRSFAETASRYGMMQYPVHIKIDTGMHRLGFMPEEISLLTEELLSARSLKVASVFSHLAASEEAEHDGFTMKQAGLFIECAGKIREGLKYGFLMHILNSAGICRFPQFQFDMVRPGIGLYGISGCKDLKLTPAGRFITRILQVKRIPAGEPVGYGCSDIGSSERIIAILPAGYADGLNRRLGKGTGSLFIKGRHARIVGNICMDMCMADITGIDAAEGDEAEIFGTGITVEEVAEKCGTIPYEILTAIPERVKRVFYRE